MWTLDGVTIEPPISPISSADRKCPRDHAAREPARQVAPTNVLAIRPDDLDACRALLRTGSKSFYAASFLLPDRIRAPACALYAFCRVADDAIDVAGGDGAAIAALRERISAAYAGYPSDTPYDRAFAATVAAYVIPRAVPDALIEGFTWDVAQRRYETIDDLLGYAARVAGTVGAMMCLLMERRDSETLARATELGLAMQLTNIARDVGEDARAGRLYLPLAWCREEGVDPDAWMAAPRFTSQIARVIGRVLDVADQLYARADSGIAELPIDCRRGIRAARTLYAEIGEQVRRRGMNSVDARAVVSKSRKFEVLARAILAPPRYNNASRFTMFEASRFLVDAVSALPANPLPAHAEPPPFKWWDLHTQALHLIELLEGLERRDRQTAAAGGSGFENFAGEAQRT
ncbi:MAG: phytoene/squalene synthase family protein [Hyphomicrobium sp.]|nr:phytoene/squalene synthase family protein [Hyphomicrobium sp.]